MDEGWWFISIWIVNVERTSICSKSITTYTYVEVEIIFTEPDLCDLLTFSLCSFWEVVYKSMAREGHGVFIMPGLDNVNKRRGPYSHTADCLASPLQGHDKDIKWKHFPCYWPFVRGIFPSQRPVTWSIDVFFICAWTNGWVNNWDASDLRCHAPIMMSL